MLSGKVALITGAARGIGLASARLLLKNGAKVLLVDFSETVGKEACLSLQKEFSKNEVLFQLADVSKKEELRAAFEKTKKVFGGVDIVCNNAGIADENNWRKLIEINLVAVIEGTYLGIEYMSTKRGGRGGTIINVASMGGVVPMIDGPGYCASKHGVVGFTRSMTACAHTDAVRVNCICPEFVNTRMVTGTLDEVGEEMRALIIEKGLIQPETIAEGILELITDTEQVGKVMTVTKTRGRRYVRLFGDPKPKL